MDHVHRPQELVFLAPLLGADEELLRGESLRRRPGEPVFLERERERLLAEDVLARLECLDRDLHVPVVGRDDAHDVDVGPVEHAAIVAVGVGPALAGVVVVAAPFRMAVVDVTHRHDVAELGVGVGVTGAHRAGADAADPRAVVGRGVREGRGRPGECRHEASGDGSGASERPRKKTSPRGTLRVRHVSHS